ncbi:MAG: glycerate kinase [Victivallales bacterium]|nr:glycerate kinase [Victivallales bacterium]
MKIVIAPDSFKGTLRAVEVCRIWRQAFAETCPAAELVCLPMSDGGEGSLQSVEFSTHAKLMSCEVADPLSRTVMASFALFDDGHSAFVETAAACGIELLKPEEKNPMKTTSYGAGQLIGEALKAGARTITVAIGGSATVDGGMGLLQALGFRLLDSQGNPISHGGAAMAELAAIDASQANPLLREATITIASDVTNPLLGPQGSATVFGPQKGATPEMVQELERGLAHFAEVAISSGFTTDCTHPGDGAAGGLGFALRAFLNAKTESGATIIAHLVHLEEHLEGADYLITGEGKTDEQTLFGKLPAVVADLAAKHGVPAILCSGAVEDAEKLRSRFMAVFSTLQSVQPLEQVMACAEQNLHAIACSIASLLSSKGGKK